MSGKVNINENPRSSEAQKDEEWKDIPGYEGLYQASTFGRVRGLKRCVGGRMQRATILKQILHRDGYPKITLYKDHRSKHFQTHRIIAMTFIPNPDDLPQINHKDENKINNHVENLEWCTRSYNCKYGHRNDKSISRCSVKVAQLDLNGNYIAEYSSMREAGRITGVSDSKICEVCHGHRNTTGGYKWKIINN